tara:strand:+ start:179 stop:886 length:708 start_codon:yes stop_codon:yes gene_type:complete
MAGVKTGISGQINNNIVTDGLVFYVDPAYKKSWNGPDSSTVNDLISTPIGTIVNDTSGSFGDNKSFTFDGTDNRINGTSNIGITGNNIRSFSVWYKTSSSDAQIPFSLGGPTDSTAGSQFAYCINRSSETDAAIFGKTSTYDTPTFTVTQTNDGNWHNVVVTDDQSNLRIYIDTILEETTPSKTYSTSDGFTIGTWSDSNRYFNGDIGPIQVYNKTLSALEVLQNYQAQKERFGF